MKLHYKEQYTYLVLLSLFCYLGTFFIESFSSGVNNYTVFLKIVSILLITINSFAIIHVIQKFTDGKWDALLVSALYIVSVTHLDVFLRPEMTQFLFAETLLIFGIVSWVGNYLSFANVLLIAASVINFKLIAILPFTWGSDKFSKKHKIYSVVSSVVIFAYAYPFLSMEDYGNNVKNVISIFESIVLPINISFLNFSLLVPNYYSNLYIYIFLLTLVAVGLWAFREKEGKSSLILAVILSPIISVFFPVKNLSESENLFYLISSTLYPVVLLALLLITFCLKVKFKNRYVTTCVCLVILMNLITSVVSQRQWVSEASAWENEMIKFPSNMYYKELVYFKMANVFVDRGYTEKALNLINDSKKEFISERWYKLHLKIAVENKDEKVIQEIQDDLIRLKIPYDDKPMKERKY